jgi:hypothetical protein
VLVRYLQLVHIHVPNGGVIAIENLCELLKGRTPGLHVEKVDKDEFDKDPNLEDVSTFYVAGMKRWNGKA